MQARVIVLVMMGTTDVRKEIDLSPSLFHRGSSQVSLLVVGSFLFHNVLSCNVHICIYSFTYCVFYCTYINLSDDMITKSLFIEPIILLREKLLSDQDCDILSLEVRSPDPFARFVHGIGLSSRLCLVSFRDDA
jgi:hypothetical protein